MKVPLSLALCATLTLLGASTGFSGKSFPSPNDSSDTFDQIADETLYFINRGYQEIPLNNTYKEVVLVVGNTGAGKTTLTKFITGQPLIAYKKAGRILIKDADNKISHEITSVSKTIFPELFLDKETNIAYFDLPGFLDTRNASIELANAWFMKLVADHVNKVKIVFIVNYSALRSGESRTDFKNFLENAISFILKPLKFQPAIALVASKVDSFLPEDLIISEITEFLEAEKPSLQSIFEDKEQLQKVLSLVDAFLLKSSSGGYDRIGFFKQPANVGPIDDVPEIQVRRMALKNLINKHLQYVQTEPDDFGISITDHARNYVSVIIEKLNSKFTAVMTQAATGIQQYYQQQGTSQRPLESFLGKFIQEIAQLERMVQVLSKSTSRLSFIEILEKQMLPLWGFNSVLKELRNLHKTLEFYENVSKRTRASEILQWTQPLQTTLDQLKLQASKFLDALNTKAETYAGKIIHSLESVYKQTVQGGSSSGDSSMQEKIKNNLANDLRIIDTLKNNLPTQMSFNSYWSATKNSLGALSVSKGNSLPPLLGVDIPFQAHPELKKDSWIRTLYGLITSISNRQSEFIGTLQQKKQEEEIKALNLKIANILQENARELRIAQDKERRLNESINEQKRLAAESARQLREMGEKQIRMQQACHEDAKRRYQEAQNREALLQKQIREIQSPLACSYSETCFL
ncbi:unnamed protein product [Allacma fusca]|uniref:ABC transporter domain-containing protein n=1 Tax=Allacma fusca TaxID=39272 RepID=A0A8J2LC85_9HEXA|nr:unnamed protein product [Allacma fusca]